MVRDKELANPEFAFLRNRSAALLKDGGRPRHVDSRFSTYSVHVDRDGNVWIVDSRPTTPAGLKKFPGEQVEGNIVVKFSPEGTVLMTRRPVSEAGDRARPGAARQVRAMRRTERRVPGRVDTSESPELYVPAC